MMPDVTGWSEEEILDYENGLAAQESLSSPRQEAYLDAYRVAAMRAIDEGLGSQWLRDEEHRLRHMTVPCLINYGLLGVFRTVLVLCFRLPSSGPGNRFRPRRECDTLGLSEDEYDCISARSMRQYP